MPRRKPSRAWSASSWYSATDLVELVLLELLQVQQRDVGALRDPEQLIQLDLQRLGVAILRVLNQEHHQEGDDGGPRVDHELPAIAEPKERAGQDPHEHDTGGEEEGDGLSGQPADRLGEPSEHGPGLGGVHAGLRERRSGEVRSSCEKFHPCQIAYTGDRSTPNLFGLSPAEALVRQRGADSRIAVQAFGAATSDAAGERVLWPDQRIPPMTTNKDFKRLVRGRMLKTGESYTAARSNLLKTGGAVRAVRRTGREA